MRVIDQLIVLTGMVNIKWNNGDIYEGGWKNDFMNAKVFCDGLMVQVISGNMPSLPKNKWNKEQMEPNLLEST